MRQVVLEAMDFYRGLMRHSVGADEHGDAAEQSVPRRGGTALDAAERTSASRCLDRCLTALDEIDANANLATLIGCWIDDLAQSTLPRTLNSQVRCASAPGRSRVPCHESLRPRSR